MASDTKAITDDFAALDLRDDTRGAVTLTSRGGVVTVMAPLIWREPRIVGDWDTWTLDVRPALLDYDAALRARPALEQAGEAPPPAEPTPIVEAAPETPSEPEPTPPLEETATPAPTDIQAETAV